MGSSNLSELTIVELGEAALTAHAGPGTDPDCQRMIWQLAHTAEGWPDLLEIVPGMNNCTFYFNPLAMDGAGLAQRLRVAWERLGSAAPLSIPARTVELPVRYGGADGPDLEVLAELRGISPEQLVALHCEVVYQVFCLGFLPGFAYLGGLDPRLAAARRATPRLRVPAGSVGVGGHQTGVYPIDSPGGWHLLGRTDERLFDPLRNPAALLQPGDRVRFVRY